MLLQPPHLALRPAAELGRVEQDAVVAAPAPDFARGEFGGIVDDPADRPLGQARQRGIGASALDRLLRRVDMDQPGAGFAEQQRADAGVAEQVEHLGVRRRAPASSPIAAPCRGRRRDGGTASGWRGSGPRRAPAASSCGTSRCWTQRPPPSSSEPGTKVASGDQSSQRRRPHRLRFGPDDGDRAIALPLPAVAAVDQAPVVPGLGDDRLEIGQAHAASASLPPIEAMARGPVEHRRAGRPRGGDVDRAQLGQHFLGGR